MQQPKRGSRSVRLRTAFPIGVCIAGIALLIGCEIPFTHKEKIVTGTDFRPFAGDGGDKLQNGKTTRADILGHLGLPQKGSSNSRFIAYYLQTNTGFWVVPLCFTGAPQDRFALLLLEFDDNDVLIQYQVRRFKNMPYIFSYVTYTRDQVLQSFAHFTEPAATRPSTLP
jgi:hypothetical protein